MYKYLNQSIAAFVFVAAALLLSGQVFADHGRRPNPVIAKTIYKEIYRPISNHRIKHNKWRHNRQYRDDHRHWHGHNPSYRKQHQAHRFENRGYKPKHFYRKQHQAHRFEKRGYKPKHFYRRSPYRNYR